LEPSQRHCSMRPALMSTMNARMSILNMKQIRCQYVLPICQTDVPCPWPLQFVTSCMYIDIFYKLSTVGSSSKKNLYSHVQWKMKHICPPEKFTCPVLGWSHNKPYKGYVVESSLKYDHYLSFHSVQCHPKQFYEDKAIQRRASGTAKNLLTLHYPSVNLIEM
jgi:hypothetical protein